MAASKEKLIWPLIGVIIFAVLTAFYYDDRKRLEQKNVASNQKSSSTQSTAPSTNKPAVPSSKPASTSSSSGNSLADHQGFSGSIDNYLAEISAKRDASLIASAKEHSGYSGSAEDYLRESKPTNTNQYQQEPVDDVKATSMTMKEYLAKNSGKGSKSNNSGYSGSMDGYLEKYGDGQKTTSSGSSSDPFNKKGHVGFHGSYDDYAKKYN